MKPDGALVRAPPGPVIDLLQLQHCRHRGELRVDDDDVVGPEALHMNVGNGAGQILEGVHHHAVDLGVNARLGGTLFCDESSPPMLPEAD